MTSREKARAEVLASVGPFKIGDDGTLTCEGCGKEYRRVQAAIDHAEKVHGWDSFAASSQIAESHMVW